MKRIFLVAAAFVQALALLAQQMPPIPVDPAVRIGKLDNGLTYYIRHNEEPKGQANFYIAQKVGSILEEESQRGLAHFLEHMCFNGTQKFPGNGIIRYCESIGVKFGADLNAYTSIDETVYNIDNVPVANVPSAIDSCLWILHDWADGLLLEGADIDKERGVIHEEWRSRNDAASRMYECILPEVYGTNRYGYRLPIGTMEVVDNFPYQVLRDYYEKWYRPDQQGIVVVGDIDLDDIEGRIRDIFGTIKAQENSAERIYIPVEDNVEPIVSIHKDKEQPNAMTYLFLKHEAVPAEQKGDLGYLVYKYMSDLADIMMEQRLQELLQSAEPPFVYASIGDDDFFLSKTKGAYTGIVVYDETKLVSSVCALYREMLRAIRGGFTPGEYERAKAEYMTNLESAYNSREKTKSATYCRQYVRHFIDAEPIPGIENKFGLMQQLSPNIPVEAVNQLVSSFDTKGQNLVAVCMLPDKEGVEYPDNAALTAALRAVEQEDIAPYVDEATDQPLIGQLPAPGKVKSQKAAPLGYTLYTLSNGAKVYFKSTDFNKDEVLLSAFSMGGSSLYSENDVINLKNIDDVMSCGGLGEFSSTALTKALAGKKVSLDASIGLLTESLSGKSTPKDIETLMQLVYLRFTAPRMDNDAFTSLKTRAKASLMNAESEPMTALQDTLTKALYDNNPRAKSLKAAEVDLVDYERSMQIARERFAGAGDFSFVITGNIDSQTLLPLLEQYIASLPKGKKEKFVSNTLPMHKGVLKNEFEKQMTSPMATNFFLKSGYLQYNLRNSMSLSLACQALTVVLLEEIREKEGGTYGISARGSAPYIDKQPATMQIIYQTSPERCDELNAKVDAIVDEFIKNGPSEENLAKGKEYLAKKHEENLRENRYWQNCLLEILKGGVDNVASYQETLSSITSEDARKVFETVCTQGNDIRVIMKGVE